MTARRSDSFFLEAYLRRVSRSMGAKVLDPYASMNTPHDNPVLVQWGSNSIVCDRSDLEPLLDALDPENEITPNAFLNDMWMPFLREHADEKPVTARGGFGNGNA